MAAFTRTHAYHDVRFIKSKPGETHPILPSQTCCSSLRQALRVLHVVVLRCDTGLGTRHGVEREPGLAIRHQLILSLHGTAADALVHAGRIVNTASTREMDKAEERCGPRY